MALPRLLDRLRLPVIGAPLFVISNPDLDEFPEATNDEKESPRYHYAVIIEQGTDNSPRGVHFGTNLLPAGTKGVSNTELSK